MPETNGIQEHIVHILKIFPKISPSMLHITLGSSLPKAIWNPILEDLIKNNIVQKHSTSKQAPNGRMRNYTILSLKTQ